MDNNKELKRRWLVGLGVLAVVMILAWQLEKLAILTLLSFTLAYVLNPLVTRLARLRFFNRLAATLIVLLGLSVAVLAVAFVIIPEVVTETRLFLARLPQYASSLQSSLIPKIEQTFDIAIPVSLNEAFTHYKDDLNEIASKVIGPLTDLAALVFGKTFSVFFAVVGTFMFPLFLFFLLKDFPKIVKSVDNLIPLRNRGNVHQLASEVDQSLSAFLHGQFTVMLVLGILYSAGYLIVGIPVALGVGLLTGILCFIPYIGAATGFVMALLLSLLAFTGIGQVLGVVIVFTSVQLLDAALITPKVLGGKLGLTPLWIIVALMAGGELFGFLGVLLAVPSVAVLKVLVSHSLQSYTHSKLYLAEKEAGRDSSFAP